MARQIIDIGVEGNDGTGDSIRESFRKTNENFREIYAVVGEGGKITFTSLSDTPDSYEEYIGNNADAYMPIVKQDGTGIEVRKIVSDTGSNSADQTTVDTVDIDVSESGKVILRVTSVTISQDLAPSLGGSLNASGNGIGNVSVTESAVTDYNALHTPNITIDDLVIDKKYADQNYLQRQVPGDKVRLRDEPIDASEYTKTIQSFANSRVQMTDHGLDASSNGSAWIYEAGGTEATGLTSGETYYLRVVNSDELELYETQADALLEEQADRELVVLEPSGGAGLQTLRDVHYDDTLYGNWLSTEALPRKSVVRKQGDTMEGTLYLDDHPGSLAGQGSPNGISDLQAATKYYVDSSSFSSPTNLYVSTAGTDQHDYTPVGLAGRSWPYAYRTIGAAARKAEEIQITSKKEPGPYMQTITYTDSITDEVKNTYVTGAGIDSPDTDDLYSRSLIRDNADFIVAETLAWFDYNIENSESTTYNSSFNNVTTDWTDHFYNAGELEKDLYNMLNSVSQDHVAGIRANGLSIRAGLDYYEDETGKNEKGLSKFIYISAIERAKLIVDYVLRNDNTDPYIDTRTGTALQTIYSQVFDGAVPAGLPDQQDRDSIAENFDTIKDIVERGVFVAPKVIDGRRYQINVFNGGTGFVNQGDPDNTDLRIGKAVVGKTSGAIGRITKYNYEDDPNSITPTNNDSIFVELLEPIEFLDGEELEYGNTVQEKQVTIHVESGIYYEDYPIRVANNVSVKGDEFRRVIVRPKNRPSLSPWSNVYFYRDLEFDGLRGDSNSVTGYPDTNLPTDGTPYINPLTGVQDGWFGRHYLVDPTRDINIDDNGQLTVTNHGNFHNASRLIEKNRSFLQAEVIAWIDAQVTGGSGIWNGYTYDSAKSSRDIGLIVDAIVADLKEGGRSNTLAAQGSYYPDAVSGQEAQTSAAIQQLNAYILDVVNNTAITPLSSESQFINANIVKEDSVETPINELFDLMLFAFDADFNPARNNTELDAFMMNNATILRNMTVQGHGGFMSILDPEGQILTKSPYIQTGSSFSQSINRQAFRGGMLVDAFCGNTPLEVTNVVSPFELEVEGDVDSGLFIRKPQVPAPFYIDGIRYQVNDIIDYDPKDGILKPTATLILDPSSANGNGFTLPSSTPITLQTAGNRSMLGNDFTQVNDLGYGLLVMNGGLSEMVSMFTYYCHAAYYSYNGSQIRSVAGSNANGNYGLVAEGADPNEVPDDVTLLNDMVQSAKTFSAAGYVDVTGTISVTAGETLSQAGSDFSATVAFTTPSARRIYVDSISGTLSLSEQLIGSVSGSLGASSIPVSIDTGFTNDFEQLSLHFYDTEHIPTNKGELDIIHNISGSDTIARYEIANISRISGLLVDGYVINSNLYTTASTGTNAEFVVEKSRQNGYSVRIENAGSGYSVNDTFTIDGSELGGVTSTHNATITVLAVNTDSDLGALGAITSASISGTINVLNITPVRRGQVYRANFSTGNAGFSNDGLIVTVGHDEFINIRSNQNFIFSNTNDPENLTIRPSTAVNFAEDPEYTYRSISFGNADAAGNDLAADEVYTAFDANYDFVRFVVDESYASSTTGLPAEVTGTSMGGTIGDEQIAINPITELRDINRLNNNSSTPAAGRPADYTNQPRMVITWNGKKHYVYNYREVILPVGPLNITAATATNPVTVTVSGSGTIRSGQEVDIASVSGMTELNGNTYYAKLGTGGAIELYSDASLTTPVDGTSYTAYTSGGTVTGNLTTTYIYNSDNNAYGLVDIDDVANSDIALPASGTGISAPMYILGETTQLRAGLQAGAAGTITVNISTCRATGHDFLDIGSGSYNESNYPNVLLGFPAKKPSSENETQERNKGRVFYVSTDQDGFFRVGRFFTVDQGTGTVTFSASIALSDVDGIGFKRGVVVTEFSTDSAMSDNAIDTVPVESAVRAYVNRRLGYDHAGIPINNPIGPGVIVQNGNVPMTGDLNMAGNYINNVANIDLNSDSQVAVNKAYVDAKSEAYNKFALMRDVSVYNGEANQLLAISGTKTIILDAGTVSGGEFEPGITLENQDGTVEFGTVVGVFSRYDSVYGDVVQISYTETNTGITVGANVYTSTGVSAEVIDGIYDEIINVSEASASDIEITVVRSQNNNSEDPDTVPNFPTASIDLQIHEEVIQNVNVAPNAGIVQSKLNMQEADTYDPDVDTLPAVGDDDATVQATLGLAKFNSDEFSVTRGWTSIADNGITLGKIQQVTTDTVIGRSATGTGNVSEVSFNTVVNEGGGILHSDIGTSNNGAVVRTGTETYSIELITTTGGQDSLVKTQADGEITAKSLALGSNNDYVILALDGTGGTRLKVTTPAGGTVLTAQGGSTSLNPDVFIPGNLNIGGLLDPDGDDVDTDPDVFNNSVLQDASTSFSTSSWIASEWAYHGFIEAPGEKGSASAGIAIGAGSGKASTGEVAIVVANSTSSTSPVVATFSSTGFKPDTTNAYDIGAADATYKDVYATYFRGDLAKVNGDSTAETVVSITTPTANRSISFPNAGGTVAVAGGTTASTAQGELDTLVSVSTSGTITVSGSVSGVSTSDSPTFAGLTVSGNIVPNANNTINIGSGTSKFNTVYASVFDGTATQAQYADLAENYLGDADYEPGTVLVLGGAEEVTVTNVKGDRRVAGIVTTNPAHLMNSGLEGDHVIGLALKGRVPCKVIGKVQKGDLLVTSAIPGYAIVDNDPKIGTIIGKAISEKLDLEKGVVEVLVGRT